MAKIPGKGCKLQIEIATVLTDVAQLISLDLPEAESETYESDTLDNTDPGIPYTGTGRVEGGSVGFEGFLDPVGTTFQSLTDLLTTPIVTASNDGGAIKFSDTAATSWPFLIAGISIGGSVALNDGVKFSGSIKLNKTVTYP